MKHLPIFLKSTILAWGLFLFPTVIGLIAALILPKILNIRLTKEKMEVIALSLEKLKKDIKRYPSMEEGLSILEKADKIYGWQGPYLNLKDLRDSWGNEFKYFSINGKLVILSYGPNGKQDTTLKELQKGKVKGDDLVKWVKNFVK